MSHAGFLRDLWGEADSTDEDFLAVVRGLHKAGERAAELPPREAAAAVARTIAELPGLSAVERALLVYVARLTLCPRGMTAAALTPMREAGLDDQAIHDVMQVVACFSFMNRLADGTGVTLTEARQDFARELLGEDALAAHLAWGAGQDASRSSPL